MITEKKKTKVDYKLTPEEMWKNMKKEDSFGIEGYVVPRKYCDHYKYKEKQRRLAMLNKPPRHEWPPKEWKQKDEDGNDIIKKPRRPNFLDEVFKWVESFNGLPKGGDYRTYKEDILSKTQERFEKYPPPKKVYRDARREFLKNEKEKKEKKEELEQNAEGDAHNSHKQENLDKVKEQMEEDEKKKMTVSEKNKKKYGKDNPQWPRCDRVTVVADAEYCGEQVPFYNTFKKEDEEEKREFFPHIDKTSKYKRAPKWKFARKPYKKRPKNLKADEEVADEADPIKEAQDRKKEQEKERMDQIMEGMLDKYKVEGKDKNAFLAGDVNKAYNTVRTHGNIYFKYMKDHKDTIEDYENTPHKIYVQEEGPKYFATPSAKDERRMKYLKKHPDQRTEDDEEKFKYMVDRRKIDKFISKPMRTTVY